MLNSYIFLVIFFNVRAFAEEKIEAKKLEVNYINKLLTVKAQSITLEELCKEISDKAKIEIVLDKEVKVQKISVEFKNLSLKEGVEKILDLTGLKDLAISWKEKGNIGVTQELPKYEISKVEIHKRLKEGIVKTENTEKKEIKHENNKEKSHFVKTDKKIELKNNKSEVINSIELKREEKPRKVGEKIDGRILQYEEVDIKEVKGKVSENGEYAVILTMELIAVDDKILNQSANIKYINNNNKVLWENRNINIYDFEAAVSQDGNRIGFTEVKEGGWIVIYNKDGKELFKSGPYSNVGGVFLTKNGKFGYSGDNNNFICFNVDTGEIYILANSLVPDGWIGLSEDGEITVEKGRKVHNDGRIERGQIIFRHNLK